MITTLRDVRTDDSAQLLEWRNSPDVARYMYTDHLISPDEHQRWFSGIARHETAGTRKFWIIEADSLPVGLVNLYDIGSPSGRATWAFYIADPNVRGKGVGSAVERLVIDYAFDTLQLDKLWCEVLCTNEAVCRLHAKIGFVREATFRAHVTKYGAPVDVAGYGMLKNERPS